MAWSLKTIRLRSVWLMVPAFVLLARPTSRLIAAGLVLAVVGGVLRAWAAGTIQKNRLLATGGPYAHTRNPLYVGSFLVGLGLTIGSGSAVLVALFLAFFGVVYGKTMRAEERNLENLFGDQFRTYAAEVPLFVPRLRPYRPAEPHATQFLLRRYFRHREWEFALGVTLGFLALAAKMLWW